MIKAIDANMYLYLFVENIAPIQEIDTANCIHFKLNSVVLNIHIDKKDNAKTNSIAFNIYFSFIFLCFTLTLLAVAYKLLILTQ